MMTILLGIIAVELGVTIWGAVRIARAVREELREQTKKLASGPTGRVR